MPVHTNSINGFLFLEMQGPPYLRQQQLEIIERPGVDGSGVRRLGKRGKPFQLQTTNYLADFSEAHNAMLAYKDLVGDDPVSLTRRTVSEGTFLVLEVVERNCYAIFNSLGGFDGGEEVCHEVIWTLLG